VDIHTPQGFAAEASTSAVLLASSHFGFPLSTTHVATGSILGSGVGKRLASVRWAVAGRMAGAWLVTLPAAGLVGAVAFKGAEMIGGTAGVIVIGMVMIAFAAGLYLASRRAPVNHDNVNADWSSRPSASPCRPELERTSVMTTHLMATALIDTGSLIKVLMASVLAGAGLVAVFALGIVGLSAYQGQPGNAEPGSGQVATRRQLGLLVALTCFAVVIAGVAYGLYVMLNK